MALLEAKGIKKRFGGVIALSDGNVVCEEGRITGLLGANGSGKSTISKIVTGAYTKDEGSILYEGKEVVFKDPHEAKRAGIAMAYQNLSLIPDLTVWQNIVLANEPKSKLFLKSSEARKISREILEDLYPGLDIEKKVSQLSPGEMQIVEIAKAVSTNPKVLFLDEPTAALEQKEVKNLFDYMRKIAKKGVAMIFTSHRLWEIEEICDDIIIFRNGANSGYLNFDEVAKDRNVILKALTGEEEGMLVKKEHQDLGEENYLEVSDLNYGKILNNIDFNLRKGEVLGIGGLAGQGQAELLLALAGNYPDVHMNVKKNGQSVKISNPVKATREGIFLVPGDRQKEGLSINNSVYDNVVFAKMWQKKAPFIVEKEKIKKETEEIIKALSIKTDGMDAKISTLSGGNQQKVVVGKWLPFEIGVLLLSDPAKGIDIAAKKELYEFIMNMVKETNMSVILYASDNDELVSYSDRVAVMYEGKIVEELHGEEITDSNIVRASMCLKKEEVSDGRN